MKRRPITARVPGKVMLAGEYAVLDGGSCLACTVDSWLEVHVQAESEGQGCSLRSNLWPHSYLVSSDGPKSNEPLMQTVAAFLRASPTQDFTLTVASELIVSHGLGSSSALRLGILLALKAFARQQPDADVTWQAAHEAWQLQRQQQAFASGYDVLTQVSGGLVHWRPDAHIWPGQLHKQPSANLSYWVHLFAGGRGAPTGPFGSKVRLWLAQQELGTELQYRSENLIEALLELLLAEGPRSLLKLCQANREHRQLFAETPGYPLHLLEQLQELPGFDHDWTFKTTGAGGEDAILLLGAADNPALQRAEHVLATCAWRPLKPGFTDQGASWKMGPLSL